VALSRVCFRADGQHIVSDSVDETVKVWRLCRRFVTAKGCSRTRTAEVQRSRKEQEKLE
jgi:hypothetical protein